MFYIGKKMLENNLFSTFKLDCEKAIKEFETEARQSWKCLSYKPKNESKALIDFVIGGGRLKSDSIKKLREEGIDPKSVAYMIFNIK